MEDSNQISTGPGKLDKCVAGSESLQVALEGTNYVKQWWRRWNGDPWEYAIPRTWTVYRRSFQPMSTANFKAKQNKNKKVVTARSEVVGSRLVECFWDYLTIQMPKMMDMDMGATGLDVCHAGFQICSVPIPILGALFCATACRKQYIFFKLQSFVTAKNLPLASEPLNLDFWEILELLTLETFVDRVNAFHIMRQLWAFGEQGQNVIIWL